MEQDEEEREGQLWYGPTKSGQPTGVLEDLCPSELSPDEPKWLGLFTPTVISHWLWAVSKTLGVRLSSAEAHFAGPDRWSSLLTNTYSWSNSPSLRRHLGSTSCVHHSALLVLCKSILCVRFGGSSPGLQQASIPDETFEEKTLVEWTQGVAAATGPQPMTGISPSSTVSSSSPHPQLSPLPVMVADLLQQLRPSSLRGPNSDHHVFSRITALCINHLCHSWVTKNLETPCGLSGCHTYYSLSLVYNGNPTSSTWSGLTNPA